MQCHKATTGVSTCLGAPVVSLSAYLTVASHTITELNLWSVGADGSVSYSLLCKIMKPTQQGIHGLGALLVHGMQSCIGSHGLDNES